MARIWKSKALQKLLGGGWLFDGNKLAWLVFIFRTTFRGTTLTFSQVYEAEQRRAPTPR